MHRPQTRLKTLFSHTGKDSDFVAFVFKCFFERTSALVGIARQVWPSVRLVVMATQCCRNVHRILAPVGTLRGKQNKAAESSSLPRIFNNHSGEVSRYVNRMSTFAGEPQCIEVSLLYCIGHRLVGMLVSGIWKKRSSDGASCGCPVVGNILVAAAVQYSVRGSLLIPLSSSHL